MSSLPVGRIRANFSIFKPPAARAGGYPLTGKCVFPFPTARRIISATAAFWVFSTPRLASRGPVLHVIGRISQASEVQAKQPTVFCGGGGPATE